MKLKGQYVSEEKAALRSDIQARKAEMRAAIHLAIAEGRIPGKPSDYTVSVPIFRGGSRTPDIMGFAHVRTRLIPALDLRVMQYEDYPHHDKLDVLSKEIGFPVQGSG